MSYFDQMPQIYQHPFQAPQQQSRTAWTDLEEEKRSMTAGEATFVANSEQFKKADMEFKIAFSRFLELYMIGDFLKWETTGIIDRKLLAVRHARETYNQKANKDNEILEDPEVKALIEKKRNERNE